VFLTELTRTSQGRIRKGSPVKDTHSGNFIDGTIQSEEPGRPFYTKRSQRQRGGVPQKLGFFILGEKRQKLSRESSLLNERPGALRKDNFRREGYNPKKGSTKSKGTNREKTPF